MPGTDKEVNNEFDNDYGTSVDLVKATEESINTAFVDLSVQMGARKVVDAAVDAGIPEDTPGLTANAVTTLGTASVRNIDMANAYATFAAQGEAAQWYTVQEVKGANGGTRYQAKPKTTRAFDEDVMADVSYALQQVVENGTGAEAQSLGRPAAGKTGTAALRPDTTTSAWFVGYTPQLSAAVDFYKGTGRADLDGVGGLPTFFGGEYPARIWTAFMTAAMQGKEVKDFPPRANVGETVNPQPTSDPDRRPRRRPRRRRPRRRRRPTTATVVPPSPRPGCRRRRPASRHRAPSSSRRVSNRRATARRAAGPMAADGDHAATTSSCRRLTTPSYASGARCVGGPLGRRASPYPRVVDAAAGAAGADLPHLRGGAGAEGLVPRPRVGRAGGLHARLLQRHPAAVLRPRPGRRRRPVHRAGSPTSRSSTRC